MHSHQLTTVADIKRFVLAGNARFTLVSKKSGARFTYRVKQSDDGQVFFVSLLVGANNDGDFAWFGTIKRDRSYDRGRDKAGTPGVLAFEWFFRAVTHAKIEQLEVWHEGRCGRCARTLTVPESIATGFGPECAEILGIPFGVQPTTPQEPYRAPRPNLTLLASQYSEERWQRHEADFAELERLQENVAFAGDDNGGSPELLAQAKAELDAFRSKL